MARPRYFAIVASMRTGSNLLQRTLDQFPDLICHGELFNPAFVGAPGRESVLGLTQAMRDEAPLALIDRMVEAAGDRIPGFRIFDDHDVRVLDHVARDPACIRVFLSRPAEESFVSLLIAQETGQWLLTRERRRRTARVTVDPDALAAYRARLDGFRAGMSRTMREAGLVAFHIEHAELKDLAIVNGLAAHLGSRHRLTAIAPTLMRQNPGPLAAHVTNPEALGAERQATDRVAGADARRFHLAGTVLFATLPGGTEAPVLRWLQAAAGAPRSGRSGNWLQAEARAGCIGSVLAVPRHPFARIHAAFRDRIALPDGKGFPRIRAALIRDHGLVLPGPGEDRDLAAYRAAFAGFLRFLVDNLDGRTAIRVDPVWAPQTDCLRAVADILPVTLLIRSGQGRAAGRYLRDLHGLAEADDALLDGLEEERLFGPAEVWTPELGAAVRCLYPGDHDLLGLGEGPP